MGVIWSAFGSKLSTEEALENIEVKLKSLDELQEDIAEKKNHATQWLLNIAVTFYGFAIFLYLFTGLVEQNSFLCVRIFLGFSALVWISTYILRWYYAREMRRNAQQSVKLRKRKQRILADVMNKETYKVAKEILDKFGQTPVEKSAQNESSGNKPAQDEGVRPSFTVSHCIALLVLPVVWMDELKLIKLYFGLIIFPICFNKIWTLLNNVEPKVSVPLTNLSPVKPKPNSMPTPMSSTELITPRMCQPSPLRSLSVNDGAGPLLPYPSSISPRQNMVVKVVNSRPAANGLLCQLDYCKMTSVHAQKGRSPRDDRLVTSTVEHCRLRVYNSNDGAKRISYNSDLTRQRIKELCAE